MKQVGYLIIWTPANNFIERQAPAIDSESREFFSREIGMRHPGLIRDYP